MSVRLQISVMLFMMIQAVLFFAVVTTVLITPLSRDAMAMMPFVIGGTAMVSAVLSWWLAPRLRARTWRREGTMELLR